MAATTAGAFKAYLETLQLGMPFYRDGAPKLRERPDETVPPPYGVVQESIGETLELHGDFADADSHDGVVELVQVDLYMPARELTADGTSTRVVEDYVAPRRITRALRGRGVAPHAPTRVYGHVVDSHVRWPISDNIVRHTWTVRVRRDADTREA